ncbi:Ubiquitinyl hydrolase 1 [Spironucleus salmonicida]|uniref:ubiquitinyl hydrolase 1 n=1 Tax=Spironucleus salmonicida TaxID=348837 RepID=V6LV10_9EUKA|nr:Ubiquitinyl hydrolase 1 [Spironucleus salmonicida]|eukprot:EST48467.1 Ubiquitin carboxyl-terminal hydrolase family protein [Spironucleus salmonicida]
MSYREPEGPIFCSECAYCFRTLNLCLCLQCDFAVCQEHAAIHSQYHNEFVIKPQNADEIPQLCRIINDQIEFMVLSEEAQFAAALILDCQENCKYEYLKQQVSVSSQECQHFPIANSQQSDIVQDITNLTCSKCDQKENIWMCLGCGEFSCGRKQYDGTGGNGHALEHFEATGHPVAVRITSLCQDVQEVYCYSCDSEQKISFEILVEALKQFKLDSLMYLTKGIESSLETKELVQDKLINQISNFDSIKAKQLTAQQIAQTPLINFRNTGNTCYANAVLNVLLHLNLLQLATVSPQISQSYEETMMDLTTQANRILSLSESGNIRHDEDVKPHLSAFILSLQSHFTSDENIGKQQDAAEFLDIFFNKFQNIEQKFLFPSFIKQLQCQLCGFTQLSKTFRTNQLSITCNFHDKCTDVEQGPLIDLLESIKADLVDSPIGFRCPKCGVQNQEEQESVVTISQSLIDCDKVPEFIIVKANRLMFDPVLQQPFKLRTRITNCEYFDLSKLVNRQDVQQKNQIEYPIDQLLELGIDADTASLAMIQYNGNVEQIANDFFNGNLNIQQQDQDITEKLAHAKEFDQELNYQLQCVVFHLGGSYDRGHYTALIRNGNGWIDCNDQVFIQKDEIDVDLSQGILYFYKKV